MARAYGKVLVTIWRDDDVRRLTAAAQRLYLFMISNPDLSPAGSMPLRVSKWAKAAADLTCTDVEEALDDLVAGGFVLVDRDTEEVLVRSFIKNDEGWRTPNMRKSIGQAIDGIESGLLATAARHQLGRVTGTHTAHHRSTDGEQQQPAACSQQPAPTTNTSSSSQQRDPSATRPEPVPDGDRLPAAAAAAVEMLVMHRLLNGDPANPIRARKRYAQTCRREITLEHEQALTTTTVPASDDPASWLAVNVLGLSRAEAITAASALRRHGGTAA